MEYTITAKGKTADREYWHEGKKIDRLGEYGYLILHYMATSHAQITTSNIVRDYGTEGTSALNTLLHKELISQK